MFEHTCLNNLASILEHGAEGGNKDLKRAFHLYQQAIDAGYTVALINLGRVLENDSGVDKNPRRTVQLYQRAVNAKHVAAIYNLALMLQYGAEGVDKDPQRALHLYQQAVETGDANTMTNLANMLLFGDGFHKEQCISINEP